MMSVRERHFTVRHKRSGLYLIPYIGSKAGFAHIFDELIPDGVQRIYDVFGGGGAFSIYACARFGSADITYNDNNRTVVNFVRCVRDDPGTLAEEYEKHRNRSSGEYFLKVREADLDCGAVGAGRFLYLAKNAFSGKIRFNRHNRFNAPMRKNVKCPNLDSEKLLEISRIIKDMKITNESYERYGNVRGGFLYLDPPYMGNTNSHYNSVPDTGEFVRFVKKAERCNMIMISEQNDPDTLQLSKEYAVYPIHLARSLQYFTKKSSEEIIAINYDPGGSNFQPPRTKSGRSARS